MSTTQIKVFRDDSVVTGIEIAEDDRNYDLLVKFRPEDGVPCYLVYVVYDSGDSFSSTTGNVEFVHLFQSKDKAKELAAQINDHYIKVQNDELSFNEQHRIDMVLDGVAIPYVPCWVGYFESLKKIIVAPDTVDKGMEYNF